MPFVLRGEANEDDEERLGAQQPEFAEQKMFQDIFLHGFPTVEGLGLK